MKRRDIVFMLGGAAVGWPRTAGAQQKPMPAISKAEKGSRVPVVGVLLNEPPRAERGRGTVDARRIAVIGWHITH